MLWMFAVSWEQCQDWVIISLCRLLSAAWTCLALCSRTASSSLKGLWLLWAGSASRFASAALGNWKTIPVCWLNMSVSCVHLQFTCQEYLKLDNFQKHYFTEKEASRNNKHIAKTCALYGRGKDPLAFEIFHDMKKRCFKISDYLQEIQECIFGKCTVQEWIFGEFKMEKEIMLRLLQSIFGYKYSESG